jgi:hypothetical protein
VSAAAPLPCAGSAHLTLVLSEVVDLATALRDAVAGLDPADVAARRAAVDAAAVDATLRLDGADPELGRGAERSGTRADLDEGDVAALAARERAGAAAGLAADDLAEAFGAASADPNGLGAALAALHGRLVAGLVAPDRVGMLRRGPRVVQDASVGRVLFFPTDPTLLPDAWDALLRHLAGPGVAARGPALVRAGLLHLELLRHHPFDAAGGRLARAAARLALRADGTDVAGLVAVEPVLADDPLGYLDGVAASARRGDATLWVERWAEAVGEAVRRALDGIEAAGPGDRVGTAGVPTSLGDAFTLTDAADALGVAVDAARGTLSTLVRAGTVGRVTGTSGLRFVRRT